MLRRIIRIIAVLTALAMLVAVSGTLILRSNWLSGQILARLSDRLGLDIRAGAFCLGWGGAATLGDVSIRMLLSDEVVFSAAKMEVGVGPVPLLIFGRPIRVRTVTIDTPIVFLRQYEDGHWNAQEVWEQVQARMESAFPPDRGPRLPEVVVRDAAIRMTEAGGTTQMVGPVGFDGHHQGRGLWAFDLRVLPGANLEGRVVEGGDWTHEVRFNMKDVGPLVDSLLQRDLAPVRLTGRWKGRLTRDTLQGTLQLDEGVVDRAALQGSAEVVVMSDGIAIHPQNLVISACCPAGETIRLAEGAVRISHGRIAMESLGAEARALGARIDGRWNWETRRGEFSGSWAAVGPGASSQYDGTYRFSVVSPQQGRKEAQANVTVQAHTPLGSWHAAVEARAGGAQWRRSQWQVKVPAFSGAHGARRVEVADVAAEIELRWPEARLTSLSIPAAQQVNGQARFDANTHRWSAQMAVEQWRGPLLGTTGLDLRLSAEGDDDEASISELHAAWGESMLAIKGGLSLVTWELQNVNLSAQWPAHVPHLAGTSRSAGRWRLEAGLTGRARPISLDGDAKLTGQDITLGRRPVDQVQIPVHVRADARRVEATTQPFDLLDGQWQAAGTYELSGRGTQIDVLAADLSLAAVADLAGLPPGFQGQARAAVALRMPGLEIRNAVAAGTWSARDIHIPPLAARRAQGALRIAGGMVRLDRIQLEQEGGRASAEANFRLDEPQVVSIALSASRWPLSLHGRPIAAVVDGQTKLRVNVVKKTAEGDAQVAGRIAWHDRDLADLRLAGHVCGQTVDVQAFHAQVLGGTVDGTATIPLNRWSDSVAQLRWQGIQPKGLETWLPPLTRLQGTMSGSLVVEQAPKDAGLGPGTREQQPATAVADARMLSAAHPLGPMRFVLDTQLAGGRFGTAQIDLCQMTGYVDPKRCLIENARFEVLGGRLNAQARLSRRGGTYYGSVVADFNELSLNQLVHAIAPKAGEHPGRLAGRAMVLPVFERGILLSGGGRVRLTESDLADNTIIRSLYNTLNLHFGSQKPTGTGEVELQLQGPAVVLSSVQYFNRGVEIRGAGRIENVNLGTDSPVEGYAVASTRVLKSIKLPGIRSLDRLLDVLQTSAGSVKIAGAVNNVQVQVVPLPEVLGPFRRLLWAQLRE